ncbi:hypothetical protein V1514DRAFT_108751 [Lipomyces japonicus]|uniref:uncharacterized protein n=1 Tax=Lipomyces japonicus TaxID=56871 RepID=UPI0034CF0817
MSSLKNDDFRKLLYTSSQTSSTQTSFASSQRLGPSQQKRYPSSKRAPLPQQSKSFQSTLDTPTASLDFDLLRRIRRGEQTEDEAEEDDDPELDRELDDLLRDDHGVLAEVRQTTTKSKAELLQELKAIAQKNPKLKFKPIGSRKSEQEDEKGHAEKSQSATRVTQKTEKSKKHNKKKSQNINEIQQDAAKTGNFPNEGDRAAEPLLQESKDEPDLHFSEAQLSKVTSQIELEEPKKLYTILSERNETTDIAPIFDDSGDDIFEDAGVDYNPLASLDGSDSGESEGEVDNTKAELQKSQLGIEQHHNRFSDRDTDNQSFDDRQERELSQRGYGRSREMSSKRQSYRDDGDRSMEWRGRDRERHGRDKDRRDRDGDQYDKHKVRRTERNDRESDRHDQDMDRRDREIEKQGRYREKVYYYRDEHDQQRKSHNNRSERNIRGSDGHDRDRDRNRHDRHRDKPRRDRSRERPHEGRSNDSDNDKNYETRRNSQLLDASKPASFKRDYFGDSKSVENEVAKLPNSHGSDRALTNTSNIIHEQDDIDSLLSTIKSNKAKSNVASLKSQGLVPLSALDGDYDIDMDLGGEGRWIDDDEDTIGQMKKKKRKL